MPHSSPRSIILPPSCTADCSVVGGQAVMEGVMMRNADICALALRMPDGSIRAWRRPWVSCVPPALNRPFLRGFPALLETLINGVKALNSSAAVIAEEEEDPLETWHLAAMLALALLAAVLLFVVAPHALSLAAQALGLGGDVSGPSFHLWDGFFKACVFLGYIRVIACMDDIRRVFEYHGAEHKVIHAHESGEIVDAAFAARMSRLHPRCGTTFLLFVIGLSIMAHALIIPLVPDAWLPENAFAKHAAVVLFKVALIVPIGAAAYELIRFAARMPDGVVASLLRAPGLALQRLTTAEPDEAQLEVAVVALREALGPDASVLTAPYTLEEDGLRA